MTQHFFLRILLFFAFPIFGQSFQVENKYEMTFKKSQVIKKNQFMLADDTFKLTMPDGFKKVRIQFEVSTLSGKAEIFDPNKFYLVSELHRVRVRPVDFAYNRNIFRGFCSFSKLSQEPTDGKYGHILQYKPEIRDYFTDFTIAGYQDIDIPINFGSNQKPFVRKTYVKPKKWKSNLLGIYIFIPEDINTFAVFYGAEKLMQIELVE